MVSQTLRAIPLFSQLREEDIDRVGRAARGKTFPKNSIIVFEDDPGDALYIIQDGKVKVVLSGEDGREVILSTRGAGDFFGEMSLIDNEPRSAHVIAMEESKLLVLRREDFLICLQEIPGIALGVLRSMCQRLRQADQLIGGLVLQDVPSRVAGRILDLADENDGSAVAKGITHQTIAQMVGTSRETVSRTIRDLVNQGVLDTRRKVIQIADRAALEAAANRDVAQPTPLTRADVQRRRSSD